MVVAVPAAEAAAAVEWPKVIPTTARRVRVPIRMTFAEHEKWWHHEKGDLDDLRTLFGCAPRLVVEEQPWAGHNISLGWTARAYHLKSLAFFEESLLSLGRPRSSELAKAG
jgi:hypothetical protein